GAGAMGPAPLPRVRCLSANRTEMGAAGTADRLRRLAAVRGPGSGVDGEGAGRIHPTLRAYLAYASAVSGYAEVDICQRKWRGASSLLGRRSVILFRPLQTLGSVAYV